MNPLSFEEAVALIHQEDPRYAPGAYALVREALDYSVRLFDKPRTGKARHVSGRELLDGIRRYVLSEYGPMAYRVLTSWGLQKTEDFGEIVFHLVDRGVLGRTEEDRREDFAGGYAFKRAFCDPFEPPAPRASRLKRAASASRKGRMEGESET